MGRKVRFRMLQCAVFQDQERCEEPWLAEVQEEVRYGRFSKDNFAFLHGKDTTVPCSWVAGQAACGRLACQQLAVPSEDGDRSAVTASKRKTNDARNMRHIREHECDVCRLERASDTRVANNVTDPRSKATKFVDAPAIFPNNDIKYATTKLRAQLFATHHRRAITYVTAEDMPSPDVLREKPGIAAEKIKWLQRHDRECGDLYGMLPLMHGMPVALTDHIDRNPEKQLLRGEIGFVLLGAGRRRRH